MPIETLSNYFTGVAMKNLSTVETDPRISNQHEINGVAPLKKILGLKRQTFESKFIYLSDIEIDCFSEDGSMTWYDARENHPTRTEYRLYYSANSVMEEAEEGDYFVLGLQPDDSLIVILAKEGSVSERRLAWLFGDKDANERFTINSDTSDIQVSFAARYILEQIGLEAEEKLSDFYLEDMIKKFDGKFPSTKKFSAYARETLGVSYYTDPDKVLLSWLEREEALFRMLERYLVEDEITKGFDDVDDFVSVALSVINRRKSRVGAGFEHHIEQILKDYDINYSTQKITENKSKPDFIFPHIAAYHLLHEKTVDKVVTILGVKYSCKDRWRQVLAEADKVNTKYLITVEPGISTNQTEEMQSNDLHLIVPREIHETYTSEQRQWLLTFEEFLDLTVRREKDDWGKYCHPLSLNELITQYEKHSN